MSADLTDAACTAIVCIGYALMLTPHTHTHTSVPCVHRYCRECSKLVFSGEWEEHQSHDVVAMVTEEMLDFPTHLLSPLEERKAQAVGLCGGEHME